MAKYITFRPSGFFRRLKLFGICHANPMCMFEGADVNSVSGQGYTPLLLAVSLNLEDITFALASSFVIAFHRQYTNHLDTDSDQ